jgi:hypothetical protein
MNFKDIMTNTFGLSSDLNQYIRVNIGEAKSKEEEDKFVSEDIEKIKQEIIKPSLTDKKVWELILRIIYAEMLGHSTDFAHAFVVNSVQNPNYRVKRIGYMACVLLLDENSPFRIMMVASVQKDLQNTCLYNKIISLNCLPKMICPMNASAFTDILLKQLTNPQPIVRKKAIIALIRLEQVLPGSIEKFDDVIEKCLRDSDPTVVISVLPSYLIEITKNPTKFKNLFDVFIKILQQILERKLSKDYEYENHSAPWATIKIMQILKCLARNDKVISEKLYPILENILKGFYVLISDVDVTILYQTIMTSLQIIPNSNLTEVCAEKLDLLDKSSVMKRQDRLYLMLRIIFRLIDVDKKYIINYQLLLLDCLDSPDEALRQNTIEILFKTISGQNLDLIIGKINEFIISSTDVQFRKNTIEKFFSVLEQKAPSPEWFLKRCLNLLSNGPEYVSMRVINGFITNLIEIVQYDETNSIVSEFVEMFQVYFQTHPLNDCLVQVFSWFLGSYGHLLNDIPNKEKYLIDTFDYLLEQTFEKTSTNEFIFTALSKLKCKFSDKAFQTEANSLLNKKRGMNFNEGSVRISEFVRISSPSIWNTEEKIDTSFSFMEGFVNKHIFKGGKRYDKNYKTQVQKPTEELVTKYTQQQIDNNMKKIIQNPENEFKYSGQARWGVAGYTSKNEENNQEVPKATENNNYVGLSSDDVGAISVHRRMLAQIESEKPKFVNNKREVFSSEPEVKPAEKMRTNPRLGVNPKVDKKLVQKNKIASSLFGQSEDLFASVTQPKRQFFGNSATLSTQKTETKPNPQVVSNIKQEDINFLDSGFVSNQIPQQKLQMTNNLSTSTSQKNDFSDLLSMGETTSSLKFKPLSISLDEYEKIWENLEQKEIDSTIKSNLDFATLQLRVGNSGFKIVDLMDNSLVSAAKDPSSNSQILLYVNFIGDGTVNYICRGNKQIKNELDSLLSK